MKITKVTIKNYKSFGDEKNILTLDDGITTIIGKNESGKTNILSALLECQYNQVANFANKFNKNSSYADTEIIVELVFKPTEHFDLSALSTQCTTVVFRHNSPCVISGALSELIDNDPEIKECKEILLQSVANITAKVNVSVRDTIVKKFLTNTIGNHYISEYNSFYSIVIVGLMIKS